MRVTVDTNATEVSAVMRRLFRDQIPFATSLAVKDTLLEAQKRQRAHQRRIFNVRNERFVDRAVKIRREDFPTKRKPVGILRIEPPGGAARADILTKFEDQRVKRPFRGKRLAIPVDAKRTKTGRVSKRHQLREMNFRPHGSSGRVMVGDKRTFMIREPGGQGSVFQRLGRRGSTSLRLLFTFEPQVPIRPELNFFENARRTVAERFEPNFSQAFDRAVRTAR